MQTTTMKLTTAAVALVLAVASVLALASVTSAKGPANKATGSVTWTARTNQPLANQIPGIVTEFNAHDLGPGMGDKGESTIYIPENNVTGTGTRVIDVACAHVEDGEAWFAGKIVEADGDFAGSVGEVQLTWVLDGSTPGAEADAIGGTPKYTTLAAACAAVDAGAWTGSGDVTDGNLVVHYRD